MNLQSNYILCFILCITNSCGIYTFSGASIPKEAKTVSIKYFSDNSDNTQPVLSQILTEKLKDIFVEQTNLIISEKEGEPGIVLDDYLEISCGENSIKILEIQREGKKPQKIDEFVLGSQIQKGTILSNV